MLDLGMHLLKAGRKLDFFVLQRNSLNSFTQRVKGFNIALTVEHMQLILSALQWHVSQTRFSCCRNRNSPPTQPMGHTVHVHFITCKQTHVKRRWDLKCPRAGHVLPTPPAFPFLHVAYILYCMHVFDLERVRLARLVKVAWLIMGHKCIDIRLLLHTLAKLHGLGSGV